nr:MAG TPA: hypothetical protein [Caudoviricetes sp.]
MTCTRIIPQGSGFVKGVCKCLQKIHNSFLFRTLREKILCFNLYAYILYHNLQSLSSIVLNLSLQT